MRLISNILGIILILMIIFSLFLIFFFRSFLDLMNTSFHSETTYILASFDIEDSDVDFASKTMSVLAIFYTRINDLSNTFIVLNYEKNNRKISCKINLENQCINCRQYKNFYGKVFMKLNISHCKNLSKEVKYIKLYNPFTYEKSKREILIYKGTPYFWYFRDWKYRKKIIIRDISGNTLTNFTLGINITYSYHMNENFSDIRFTYYDKNSNKEIEIPYWIKKKKNGSWAYVYVRIPEIPANGESIIYLYYGNSNAESESNMTKVFYPPNGKILINKDNPSTFDGWFVGAKIIGDFLYVIGNGADYNNGDYNIIIAKFFIHNFSLADVRLFGFPNSDEVVYSMYSDGNYLYLVGSVNFSTGLIVKLYAENLSLVDSKIYLNFSEIYDICSNGILLYVVGYTEGDAFVVGINSSSLSTTGGLKIGDPSHSEVLKSVSCIDGNIYAVGNQDSNILIVLVENRISGNFYLLNATVYGSPDPNIEKYAFSSILENGYLYVVGTIYDMNTGFQNISILKFQTYEGSSFIFLEKSVSCGNTSYFLSIGIPYHFLLDTIPNSVSLDENFLYIITCDQNYGSNMIIKLYLQNLSLEKTLKINSGMMSSCYSQRLNFVISSQDSTYVGGSLFNFFDSFHSYPPPNMTLFIAKISNTYKEIPVYPPELSVTYSNDLLCENFPLSCLLATSGWDFSQLSFNSSSTKMYSYNLPNKTANFQYIDVLLRNSLEKEPVYYIGEEESKV